MLCTCRRRKTVPPSTPATSTLPPSAMRYGRTSSSAALTASGVRSGASPAEGSPAHTPHQGQQPPTIAEDVANSQRGQQHATAHACHFHLSVQPLADCWCGFISAHDKLPAWRPKPGASRYGMPRRHASRLQTADRTDQWTTETLGGVTY